MTKLNPYLSFEGQAEEAFNFYRSVFGGEFAAVMRWGDNPQCGELSDVDKNGIMHISLPVGDSVIMASDSAGAFGQEYKAGNNFTIAISPSSREEADAFFAGLSEGGNATMPMSDAFWGGYFGSLVDKFGVQWLINYDTNQPG
jgi:PhnB protein